MKTVNTVLGFDSMNGQFMISTMTPSKGIIHPREMVTILSTPQIPFKCTSLHIPANIADSFVLHRLQVGNTSQMASATPITAVPFATNMDMLPLITASLETKGVVEISIKKPAREALGAFYLPVCMPGQDMVLMVENVGDKPLRFLAAMIGIAARTEWDGEQLVPAP